MIVRFQPSTCIEWRAYRDAETNRWVAVCDVLGRSAVGETWDTLCMTVFETQRALLTDLLSEGELESFLKEHGWLAETPLPATLPADGVNFDIPVRVTPLPSVRAKEIT